MLSRREKINESHGRYVVTKCELAFTQLYEDLVDIRRINESLIIRSRLGDSSDATSVFHDTLIKVLDIPNTNDFESLLNLSLKRARLDFIKIAKRRQSKIISLERLCGEDEEGAATPITLQSDSDTEAEAIKKNEAEQAELVDFILDSARNLFGARMTAIIEALPNYASVNDAATSNGLHRNQLARPLSRLAHHCFPKVKDDIVDYFPKGVRVQREFVSA